MLVNFFQTSVWPIRLTEYHTALQSYFLLPFLLVIRNPVAAVRIAALTFAIAAILATYFCVREFVGRTGAFLAALFLAANPFFLYQSRIGIMPGVVMLAFSTTALWCLLRWYRTGGPRYLMAASLLLGVGSCVRIWFFWLPAALLVAAAVYRKELKPRLHAAEFWAGALGFAAGSAFRWLPESLDGFRTISYIASHFPRTGYADNLAVAANISTRLKQFAQTLAGIMTDPVGVMPQPEVHVYGLGVKAHSLAFLTAATLLLAGRKRTEPVSDIAVKGRFFILLLLLMLSFSIYTLSCYRQDHLLLLLPLPQIILALGVLRGYELLTAPAGVWPRLAGAVSLGVLAVSLLGHLVAACQLERRMGRVGGEDRMSDAVYEVGDWLERGGWNAPKFYDWGPQDTIRLISRGKIQPMSCFSQFIPAMRADSPLNCLEGEPIYIFVAPDSDSNYPRVAQVLRKRGQELIVEKNFYRRDGSVAYIAYRRQPLAKRRTPRPKGP